MVNVLQYFLMLANVNKIILDLIAVIKNVKKINVKMEIAWKVFVIVVQDTMEKIVINKYAKTIAIAEVNVNIMENANVIKAYNIILYIII